MSVSRCFALAVIRVSCECCISETGPVIPPARSSSYPMIAVRRRAELIEAGREVAQREPIGVPTLMHAAAELVAPLVAAKGLTCAFQSPGDPLPLNSDPVKYGRCS
jgi:hypothetical protein